MDFNSLRDFQKKDNIIGNEEEYSEIIQDNVDKGLIQCHECESEILISSGRCPVCGAVVIQDIIAASPKEFYKDDRGKFVQNQLKAEKILYTDLFCLMLFGVLPLYFIYLSDVAKKQGVAGITDWLFDESGLFGIVVLAFVTFILYFMSKGNKNMALILVLIMFVIMMALGFVISIFGGA